MTTGAPVASLDRPRPGPVRPRPRLLAWGAGALAVALVAGVVLAFYLSVYPARGVTVPIGWDQSEYLWRTRLAQELGVGSIDEPLPAVPTPKSGRPAYPVVAAVLSSLGSVSPFRLAMALPAVLAAAIGLAAAGFAGAALGRPLWEQAAAGLGVALSPLMVRLMSPEAYMDTMFAAAVFTAAAVPLVLAVERRGALVPAVLLVGAGAAIHWSFFGFLAITLALTAALLAPASWARWRRGEAGLLDTPTARLGEVLVGGAALGAAAIFGVLGDRLPSPRLDPSELAKKLRRDLPKYRFPFALPAAALGAAWLGWAGAGRRGAEAGAGRAEAARQGTEGGGPGSGDGTPGAGDGAGTPPGRARFVLLWFLAWGAVVAAGVGARAVLGLNVPAHRFLSFALPVPVLGVLGVAAAGRLLARAVRVPAVAVLLTAAALGAAGLVAHGQWFAVRPWTNPEALADVGVAAGYLDAAGVPPDRPVVFVVGTTDWNTAGLYGHMVRAALPPARIPHAHLFVGTPQDYVARRPSDSAVSRASFERLRSVLPRRPVAVAVAMPRQTALAWLQAHPDLVITERVAVVEGPSPPPGLRPQGPPVGGIPFWKLAAIAVGSLAALGLVGLGWARTLLRPWVGPAQLLALAPAVGVAVLVLGGVLADRLGFRLQGAVGGTLPVVLAGLGFLAAVLLKPGGDLPQAPRPSAGPADGERA
jgi:hypothetical protein